MFVTLEGPEGAGKSTVVQALADALRSEGRDVLTTREPGEGEVGKAVREALLHGGDLDPWTELFLFLADRAEHVAKTVRPALEQGKTVLCDRYADSNIVYQGHARGLDLHKVRDLNALATKGLTPDVTLLLDLDPEVGLRRIGDRNRLDREPLEFHQKVRAGFLQESLREPDRWRVVDASQPLDRVVQDCLAALRATGRLR